MISVALQHHPSRADLLPRTAVARPEIVIDPDPEGAPSAWRTYLEALERTPWGVSHRLILQDDVELCDGFLEAMTLALTAKPDEMVSFFVPTAMKIGSRRLLEACTRDDAWARIDGTCSWIPVVALAWPARLIEDFTAWARPRFPPERKRYADDAIVGEYAKARNEVVWATVPSLVEHPDDVPTILQDPRNVLERHATCFVGEHASEIDWSRG